MKFLIFLLMAVQLAKSQPPDDTLSTIDGGLNLINKNLKSAQKNLNNVLANYSLMAQTCSQKLKTLKIFKNLTSALDEMSGLLDEIKTVNEFFMYSNTSTCTDVNQKIVMLGFDNQTYSEVKLKLASNQSQLSEKYSKVYSAFVTLKINLTSNGKMISTLIEKNKEIGPVFSNFISLLGSSATNLTFYISRLTNYRKSNCQCNKNEIKSNSTHLNDLKVVEEILMKLEQKIISGISTTLKNVQELLKTALLPLSKILPKYQKVLKNLQTISDYIRVGVQPLTVCSDFWIHVNFLQAKQFQYRNILVKTLTNSSIVAFYREKIQIYKNTSKVVNGSLMVEDSYRSYKVELDSLIDKISKVIESLVRVEGVYCKCGYEGNITPSKTVTSSTKLTAGPQGISSTKLTTNQQEKTSTKLPGNSQGTTANKPQGSLTYPQVTSTNPQGKTTTKVPSNTQGPTSNKSQGSSTNQQGSSAPKQQATSTKQMTTTPSKPGTSSTKPTSSTKQGSTLSKGPTTPNKPSGPPKFSLSKFESANPNDFTTQPTTEEEEEEEENTDPTPPPCLDTIEYGETLNLGGYRMSCGNCFKLYLETNGNLQIYKATPPYDVIWQSATGGLGIVSGAILSYGNFILYNAMNIPLWSTLWVNPMGNTGAFVKILDDGQLVVLTGTTVRWTSGVRGSCGQTTTENLLTTTEGLTSSSNNFTSSFPLTMPSNSSTTYNPSNTELERTTTQILTTTVPEPCKDILYYGETLNLGSVRYSCGGCFKLVLETNGNLAVFRNFEPYTAIWQTNTAGLSIVPGTILSYGNFVLVTSMNIPVWSTVWFNPMGNTGAYGKILNDGQFVIYTGSTPRYSSGVTAECFAPTTIKISTSTLSPVSSSSSTASSVGPLVTSLSSTVSPVTSSVSTSSTVGTLMTSSSSKSSSLGPVTSGFTTLGPVTSGSSFSGALTSGLTTLGSGTSSVSTSSTVSPLITSSVSKNSTLGPVTSGLTTLGSGTSSSAFSSSPTPVSSSSSATSGSSSQLTSGVPTSSTMIPITSSLSVTKSSTLAPVTSSSSLISTFTSSSSPLMTSSTSMSPTMNPVITSSSTSISNIPSSPSTTSVTSSTTKTPTLAPVTSSITSSVFTSPLTSTSGVNTSSSMSNSLMSSSLTSSIPASTLSPVSSTSATNSSSSMPNSLMTSSLTQSVTSSIPPSTLTPVTSSSNLTVSPTSSMSTTKSDLTTLNATTSLEATFSTTTLAPTTTIPCTTNIINSGETIQLGAVRTSCNKCFKLILQQDGALVVMNSQNSIIWSTGTAGRGVKTGTMQIIGSFTLFTGGWVPIPVWVSTWVGAGNTGAVAKIMDDGQFIIFTGTTPRWWNGVTGTC